VGHAKLAAIQAIDKVTAYVYTAADIEIKRADLSISGGVASGRITVPAQDDLRVALAYFEGSIVRWIGEDTDVDVPAGGETVANIEAEYMGTSVTAPDSAEVGEDYTVTWMGRPYVTGYELQEAMAADFSGAAIHASADTFKVVSGKHTAGVTFYYRARVNTDYGYGPWHSRGSAFTATYAPPTPATEGIIVIDSPMPADEPGALVEVDLPGGATMEFVWIGPGTFMMGSPDSDRLASNDEKPQYEVTIRRGFYLGKYEITQAQWEAVMGSNPSRHKGANRPVEQVSWYGVQSFIHRLNEAVGDSLYRLPTEAEWEYACRAGTTTRWSFGDDESLLGDYAWYNGNNSPSGTKEMGTKLPNPWGLYDMHGNVYEWCQDWHSSYSSGSQIDPMGPTSGSRRVSRGGSFRSIAWGTRSAHRGSAAPGDSYDGFGARLVRIW